MRKTKSEVPLKATKFNKDSQDGWRMDTGLVVLDIDFGGVLTLGGATYDTPT